MVEDRHKFKHLTFTICVLFPLLQLCCTLGSA